MAARETMPRVSPSEKIPLDMMRYFHYLNDDAQYNIMRQLVNKMADTAIDEGGKEEAGQQQQQQQQQHKLVIQPAAEGMAVEVEGGSARERGGQQQQQQEEEEEEQSVVQQVIQSLSARSPPRGAVPPRPTSISTLGGARQERYSTRQSPVRGSEGALSSQWGIASSSGAGGGAGSRRERHRNGSLSPPGIMSAQELAARAEAYLTGAMPTVPPDEHSSPGGGGGGGGARSRSGSTNPSGGDEAFSAPLPPPAMAKDRGGDVQVQQQPGGVPGYMSSAGTRSRSGTNMSLDSLGSQPYLNTPIRLNTEDELHLNLNGPIRMNTDEEIDLMFNGDRQAVADHMQALLAGAGSSSISSRGTDGSGGGSRGKATGAGAGAGSG